MDLTALVNLKKLLGDFISSVMRDDAT